MAGKKQTADLTPLEEATQKGYLGPNTDPTPDEAYTVAGVLAKQPTPETVEPGSEGSTKIDPDAGKA